MLETVKITQGFILFPFRPCFMKIRDIETVQTKNSSIFPLKSFVQQYVEITRMRDYRHKYI